LNEHLGCPKAVRPGATLVARRMERPRNPVVL
jgi:hypothetical protein